MTLLSSIGTRDALKDTIKNGVVNLTSEYNNRFGTHYTSEELRTVYLESFLKFFISQFKIYSDRMTHNSGLYHWTAAKEDGRIIPRHTPKKEQRLLLYNPLFTEAEAWVFPSVFNDRYLKLDNYEGVDFWQSIDTPESVKVKTAIPDVTKATGLQTASEEINIPYVVGLLYDKDAIMTHFYLESSAVTPLEARKRFYTTWWTFARNSINDATETMILFTMEDPV